MDIETVNKIKDLTQSLGDLLVGLVPANQREWDAHDSADWFRGADDEFDGECDFFAAYRASHLDEFRVVVVVARPV